MKLIVLLLCVVSALAVPLGQSKPVGLKDLFINSSPTDQRIVGGNQAVLGQFPWQVAAQFGIDIITSRFCGGVVISEEWILTAAQCAYLAWTFEVYAGVVSLTDPDAVIATGDITVVHPDFNPANLNNDIALAKLNAPLTLTANIQIMSLPSRGSIVGDDATLTVVGWGSVSDEVIVLSNYLNYAVLTSLSNSDCAAFYGALVIDSTLCAIGTSGTNTCFGDTGGAVVTYDADGSATLAAIISFISSLGCSAGLPSGHVRVEPYLDWIAESTGLDL